MLESRAIEIATETLAASTGFPFAFKRSHFCELRKYADGTSLPSSWHVTFYFEPTTEYGHGREPIDRGDFETCVVVDIETGDAMIVHQM